MKRNFLIIVLLLSAITGYSQSKDIIGSWISQDSINKIQFFIKFNGTIEKRTASANEVVWDKTPQIGTYTFNKGHNLVIKWADKNIENIKVKFVDNNAEFLIFDQKGKPGKPQIFLKIVDEEEIENK